MTSEKNKVVIRKWIEAYNQHDLASLNDLMLPNFFDHTFQLQGVDNFKQFYLMFFRAFPDTHATIDDIIAEGDKVWFRSTVTGTHNGEYRGLPPTGKKIIFTSIDICRIVEGKIAETESVNDFLSFYKLLGAIDYKGFPYEKVT